MGVPLFLGKRSYEGNLTPSPTKICAPKMKGVNEDYVVFDKA